MTRRKGRASGNPQSAREGEATAPPRPGTPAPGFRIGEYTILGMLGHGSMSTVFLARDATGHEVALKVFQDDADVSATLRERFRREVEAGKKLREHPNIITTYATGRDGSFEYIAMQRVDGSRTLSDVIHHEQAPIARIVGYIIRIARALAFAHQCNILHRDVKPANIMINRFDEPLLADLGVAAINEWPRFTVAGAITGTPLYMSPEQARGEDLDPRSDVYSLGVVLYEALTGTLPYRSSRDAAVADTLRAVQFDAPRRPRLYRPEISPELEAVTLRALAKNPDARYDTAEAMALDLERALAGQRVDARYYSPWSRVWHGLHRHRRDLIVLGTLLPAALGAFLYFHNALTQVHYQELVGFARLRNTQFALLRLEQRDTSLGAATPALNALVSARRSMADADWQTAFDLLVDAAATANSDGDVQALAVIRLEQARCAYMLVDPLQADALYESIHTNPEISPRVTGQALLERALLAHVTGRANDADALLASESVDPAHPTAPALACLRGDRTPTETASEADRLPDWIQNDTYLAAAFAATQRGEHELARDYLHRCLAASRSPHEWPAPLARRIQEHAIP
jgi:hypothetical protein